MTDEEEGEFEMRRLTLALYLKPETGSIRTRCRKST